MRAPVRERLGVTIVAMFQGDQERLVLNTDHKRVISDIGRRASPFSADVNEYRSAGLIPEGVIHPVSLLVSQFT